VPIQSDFLSTATTASDEWTASQQTEPTNKKRKERKKKKTAAKSPRRAPVAQKLIPEKILRAREKSSSHTLNACEFFELAARPPPTPPTPPPLVQLISQQTLASSPQCSQPFRVCFPISVESFLFVEIEFRSPFLFDNHNNTRDGRPKERSKEESQGSCQGGESCQVSSQTRGKEAAGHY
jgi:hypothetical protein